MNDKEEGLKIMSEAWEKGALKKAEDEIKFVMQECMRLGNIREEKDKLENLLKAMKDDLVSPEDAIAAAKEILAEKEMQTSM